MKQIAKPKSHIVLKLRAELPAGSFELSNLALPYTCLTSMVSPLTSGRIYQ